MQRKIIFYSIVIFCLGIICAVLLKGKPENVLNLDSVMQVGADIMRDVDKIGQSLIAISADEEMQIGSEIDKMIKSDFGQSKDLKLWEVYVDKVGCSVVKGVKRKDIKYHFSVLPIKMVNAFAVPGGYVYVTKGMLDFLKTESELANIIGHEITHIDACHAVNAVKYEYAMRKIGIGDIMILASIGHEIYRLGYSEVEELEADTGGIKLAAGAEYHPYGAVSAFKRMIKNEPKKKKDRKPTNIAEETGKVIGGAINDYFETHPMMDKRIIYIEKSKILDIKKKKYVGEKNYKQKIPLSEKDFEDEWFLTYPKPEAVLR